MSFAGWSGGKLRRERVEPPCRQVHGLGMHVGCGSGGGSGGDLSAVELAAESFPAADIDHRSAAVGSGGIGAAGF